MNVLRLTVTVAVIAIQAVSAWASDPTIPYQGRISAEGQNYTGLGYFKFSLIDGETSLWSSDGSGMGGEPAAAVSNWVNNGLFSIELGALGPENMTNIPATVLHRQLLWLRTWFSSNNITFQQLSPDATLRPIDFGKINTGNAYVVDDDGSGDFMEIQDAVDYAIFEGRDGTILVMPGYYNVLAPIGIGSALWAPKITIKGVGNPTIENDAGGAAITAWPNLVIDGVSLRGSPAVACPPSGDGLQLELRECEFVANRPESDAAYFQGTCRVDLVDCEFWGDSPTTTALRVTGEAEIRASRCTFSSWQQDGSGVVFDRAFSSSEFEHCKFYTDNQSLHSLRVVGADDDPWRHLDFNDCSFHGPVSGEGSVKGLRFRRSLLWSGKPIVPVVGLTGGNSDSIEFSQCDLSGDEAVPILVAADGMSRSIEARDTTFRSQSARTIEMRNELSHLRLENCHVTANSSEAVWVEVSAVDVRPSWKPSLEVWRSTIDAWGGETAHTAFVATNVQGNAALDFDIWTELKWSAIRGNANGLAGWWSAFRLLHSEINCHGTGAQVQGGFLNLAGTDVQGEDAGILANAAEVDIEDGATVSGGGIGVQMQDGELGISGSAINADDKAIVITGNSSLSFNNSSASADNEELGTGTGISANFASTQNQAYIIGSLAYGMVAGMDLRTGTYSVANCTVASEGTPAVLRTGQNITTFDGCRMMGLSANNTNPVMQLVGSSPADTPKPQILGSSLRSMSADNYYAIDVTGGTLTGTVVMTQCCLSTNPAPSILNIAPPLIDIRGNAVVPVR